MSDKWLRAATIGSIWASIEIIIGSFLHNIRLPFAGTILSFFAVVLMVSFLRMWPGRGIIWRASLICALMKSISPSAVILGPMTGILMEGLLMELGIFMLGINIAGMALGGMLSVLSALIHKAINLLILYGWDLARLLDNLVKFAAKKIGLESVGGLEVLIMLALVYLITGLFATISGIFLSRKTVKAKTSTPVGQISGLPGNTLFNYSDPGKYSVWLLTFNIIAVGLVLFAMIRIKSWTAALIPVPYLVFCFIRYRRSLRQLLRPKLWIQLIIITFLAAIFLNGMQSGKLFDPEGLKAGLMMNLRALLLLSGFSAISTEMKNPVIRTILYNRGFAPLYRSLSLAFAVLPAITGEMNTGSRKLRSPGSLIGAQLTRADMLFEHFRNLGRSLPKVTLIIGERGEGKTTFLLKKTRELISSGKKLAGFVAMGLHNANGERLGYSIRNVVTGEVNEFCMVSGPDEWERIGKFRINPAGLARGMEWMSPENIRDADILILDELGPLELSGKGWAPLIDRILREDPKPMIWTARRHLARKIIHKWNIGETEIIDLADQD